MFDKSFINYSFQLNFYWISKNMFNQLNHIGDERQSTLSKYGYWIYQKVYVDSVDFFSIFHKNCWKFVSV